MKRRESMLAGLIFWLLYCPLSFVIWYFQGAKSLTELIVAMCIGILIFALYLTMDFIFWAFRPVYRPVPVVTGGDPVSVSEPPVPEQESPPPSPQEKEEGEIEVKVEEKGEVEEIDLD